MADRSWRDGFQQTSLDQVHSSLRSIGTSEHLRSASLEKGKRPIAVLVPSYGIQFFFFVDLKAVSIGKETGNLAIIFR
jgi:hypothetical protein